MESSHIFESLVKGNGCVLLWFAQQSPLQGSGCLWFPLFLTNKAMKKPSLSSMGSIRSKCSAAKEANNNQINLIA